LRPQGRRGELLADPLTDLPGVLAAGVRAFLKRPDSASTTEILIESSWSPTGRNAGRIVLKLSSINSITAAESLAGQELLILSSDLPPLEPGTWFVRDLIGCELFDGTVPIGRISGVEYPMSSDGRVRLPDAAPLLEVTLNPGPGGNPNDQETSPNAPSEPALIPFVKAWLDAVDLDRKRVVMHLPAGLIAPDAPDEVPS